MKFKFKMPDSFTILFLLIVVIAFFSWFVPAGEYAMSCDSGVSPVVVDDNEVCPVDEAAREEIVLTVANEEEVNEALYNEEGSLQYSEIESNKQGFQQIFNAPIKGMNDAFDIALFIIVIGGFINIAMRSGALSAGIGILLKRFEGREQYLIPILMILFGLGGTSYGMAEETIGFYLLIIPIFLAAGYDTLTGVRIIMVGAGVGVLASTVNPFAIGAAIESSIGVDVVLGDGIISRIILFVILEAIAIYTTMRYAAKVKKDIKNSDVADSHEEVKKELLHMDTEDIPKFTPARAAILVLFGLSFILMVFAVIPWEDFNIPFFVSATDWLNNFTILGGTEGLIPFGEWWFNELTMLFLLFSIITGIIARRAKILPDTFIETFLEGARDLLSVALIIGVARGITVLMSESAIDATVLNAGSGLLEGLSSVAYVIGTYLFFIPMSFLIPSTSGLAAAAMPIISPLGDFVAGDIGVVYGITSYSAASGIVNLITPTSGVVIGGLALAKVPYNVWIKHIAKFLVVIFVITLLFLAIGAATGFIV